MIEAHGAYLDRVSCPANCRSDLPIRTGSFAEAECLECKRQYTKEAIKPQIERGKIVRCDEPKCKGVPGALVRRASSLPPTAALTAALCR